MLCRHFGPGGFSRPARWLDRFRPASRAPGFTLIELVVVMVVAAVLAAIATARYAGVRERTIYVALQAELRNVVIEQNLYFANHSHYAGTTELGGRAATTSILVTMPAASNSGWAAVATHTGLPGHRCSVFFGSAPPEPPATREGVITCDR